MSEPLTFAQRLRVRAACGTRVIFDADQLRELAQAIDGNEEIMRDARAILKRAKKKRRSSLCILGVGLAMLLAQIALATYAHSATLTYNHSGDPEAIHMTVLDDGRVSFAKDGPYDFTEKWCPAYRVAKNIELDRVERICTPRSGDSDATFDTPMRAWGAATREAAGQHRYLPRAGAKTGHIAGIIYNGGQSERTANALDKHPSPIPLPATLAMLLTALAGLYAWRWV